MEGLDSIKVIFSIKYLKGLRAEDEDETTRVLRENNSKLRLRGLTPELIKLQLSTRGCRGWQEERTAHVALLLVELIMLWAHTGLVIILWMSQRDAWEWEWWQMA